MVKLIVLFFVLSFSTILFCVELGTANESNEVPNVILVKLSSSSSSNFLVALPNVLHVQEAVPALSNLDSHPFHLWKKVVVESNTSHFVLDTLRKISLVTEASMMRRYRVMTVPSPDSLTGQQWGFDPIRLFQAWSVTSGNPNVVIGIIDTGTELTHPDLAPILWVNPGEDLNHDGIVQESEHNGIDDDGNGFIDDFWGYDFVDSQGFPTGGDDRFPDNDPIDEMGHGTAVAGIAVASSNRIGILGVAPNCRLMTLRAGNANGYLEEDDVAAALVYAAENRANVVNMSFGDVVVAPLLRDAVEYAFSRGVVLVASSGNTGMNTLHYPSGYSSVISVGATNQVNNRANFSSFGNSIAMVAPGSSIFSTILNQSWNTFQGGNGTSFSAPFVTGVAALLLSRDSTLTPSEVRTILCSSCNDIGASGWDIETGHGLLNAERALNTPRQAVGIISSPTENQSFATDSCVIIGTVAGARSIRWSLYYGIGRTPTEWIPIHTNSTQQRVRERLGVFALPSNDTTLTVRLSMEIVSGSNFESRILIQRDRTAPQFQRLVCYPAIVQGDWGWRFEVSTNDESRCNLEWTRGSDTLQFPFRYISQEHATALTPIHGLQSGMSVNVRLTNRSGLSTVQSVTLPQLPSFGNRLPLQEINDWHLPSGHLLRKEFDWNRNNQSEILLNVYNENSDYDTLKLFEFVNGVFQQRVNYGKWIAQDGLDITGDTIPELMIRAFGFTTILTPTATIPFPFTEVIPPDTIDSYGAMLVDFVPNDRHGNFIQRKNSSYEVWRVYWNNTGGYTPERTFQLSNPTRGDNQLGRPRIRFGDVNRDGLLEGVFGDTDGDLLVYRRNQDNQWSLLFTDSLGNGDATDFFDVADATGNGYSEIVAGYHTASLLRTEHEAPLRKWVFYLYRWQSSRLIRADSLIIDGGQDPKDFDAGVESGDIDGDGDAEFLISAYPYLFVMDVDRITNRWSIVYQTMNCRSNTVALFDLNRNGRKELVYNDGTRFRFLEWISASQTPPIPNRFAGHPVDTNRIFLQWSTVPNAEYVLIRALGTGAFQTIATITDTFYMDTTVVQRNLYRYAVASFDDEYPNPLSAYTSVLEAVPNSPPRLLTATFEEPNFIRVLFSEPLSAQSLVPSNFRILPSIYPTSVLSSRQNQEVLLRFETLQFGSTYLLTVQGVMDTNRTPLQSNPQVNIMLPTRPDRTFFVQGGRIAGQTFILEFSESVDATTVSLSSISITPTLQISRVEIRDLSFVHITISDQTPIGMFGVLYEIRADTSIHSLSGLPLDREFSVVSIQTQPNELQDVILYPNPVRFHFNEKLTLAGLPRGTIVRFFTPSGIPIRTIESDPNSGGAVWDGKNDSGEMISSGIYYYIAVHQHKQVRGKVAVIQ